MTHNLTDVYLYIIVAQAETAVAFVRLVSCRNAMIPWALRQLETFFLKKNKNTYIYISTIKTISQLFETVFSWPL